MRFLFYITLFALFLNPVLSQTKFGDGWDTSIKGAYTAYSDDDSVVLGVICTDLDNTFGIGFIHEDSKQFFEPSKIHFDLYTFGYYPPHGFSVSSISFGRLDLLSKGNGWSFLANSDIRNENLISTSEDGNSFLLMAAKFPRDEQDGILSDRITKIIEAHMIRMYLPLKDDGDRYIYQFDLQGKSMKELYFDDSDECSLPTP